MFIPIVRCSRGGRRSVKGALETERNRTEKRGFMKRLFGRPVARLVRTMFNSSFPRGSQETFLRDGDRSSAGIRVP